MIELQSNTLSHVMPKSSAQIVPTNGIRPTDHNMSTHKGVGRNQGIDKHKLVDVPPFRPDISRGATQPYKIRTVSTLQRVLTISLLSLVSASLHKCSWKLI